jgi:two-component system NarL family response regulator
MGTGMEGEDRNIAVVVADDHEVVREGLAAIIGRQPDMRVVGQASTGQQAVEVVREESPDVVLMDLRMPVMGGVEATARITRDCPSSRVVVLTTYDGDEDIYRALQAGARAYLLKDVRREELLSTIRAVHAGRRHVPPEIAERLAGRVAAEELTPRELGVLKLLTAGRSNKEIAAALGTTEGTIKGYVVSILGKLGASNRTEAAAVARSRGIIPSS